MHGDVTVLRNAIQVGWGEEALGEIDQLVELDRVTYAHAHGSWPEI